MSGAKSRERLHQISTNEPSICKIILFFYKNKLNQTAFVAINNADNSMVLICDIRLIHFEFFFFQFFKQSETKPELQ